VVDILKDLGFFDKRTVSGVMQNYDALDALWFHSRGFRKYDVSPTLVDLLKKIKLYLEFYVPYAFKVRNHLSCCSDDFG
jgi:hypothetical protein